MTDRQQQLVEETKSALTLLDYLIADASNEAPDYINLEDDTVRRYLTEMQELTRARRIILQHQKHLLGEMKTGLFSVEETQRVADDWNSRPDTDGVPHDTFAEEEAMQEIAEMMNRTPREIEKRIFILARTECESIEELHETEEQMRQAEENDE